MRTRCGPWLAVLLCACGPRATQVVVGKAMGPDKSRHDTMEGTLRVLDENPGYVDEFFQLARRHPATLDRFIADTARDLHEPELSQRTAKHLVRNPDGLRRILVDPLDPARD